MDTLHALLPYAAKRNFSKTPEPHAAALLNDRKLGARTGQLAFVVQKHWASHLHYDFRLEWEGTMKSWAVPKGPSLDPKQKRMAVQVEDHPLSYSSFEGTIPSKQYGAGKIIVWDAGIWEPMGDPVAGYNAGNLKFEIHGHKLHGKWALIRMKGKAEGAQRQRPWLLIKEKDSFARSALEYSVVDALPDSVIDNGEVTPPAGARKSTLPSAFSPQLATLAQDIPANAPAWIFEVKFDGYRILTRVQGGLAKDISLFTRNGNDWTSKLTSLQQTIASLKLPTGWYDGEIVVPGAHGPPDFGALQAAFESGSTDNIVLYLFDMPFFNGYDLRACSQEARRSALKRVMARVDPLGLAYRVRFSEEFNVDPRSLLVSACKLGLEGLIAKRRDSPYVSARAASWLKLKCQHRREFVIGGFTPPQGGRAGFGALLLGVFDTRGSLQHAGKVGSGFNAKALTDIKNKLDALTQETSPFATAPRIEGRPHWVKPILVAEVSFAEWTAAGRIRHGVFHGLRTDRDAASIAREQASPIIASERKMTAEKQPVVLPAKLRVTHSDRIIDASTGTTKLDLVRYYARVGDLMMAHLKGRPLSLVRAPSGVGGELFFQRHMDSVSLTGIKAFNLDGNGEASALMQVVNKHGLLFAAQWNMVEIHTVNATQPSLARPDRMVLDLDPGVGAGWCQVQEAAQLVHSFLGQLGLQAFLKTSGGKGLHIVVPLRRVHGWDAVKGFSQAIVSHLASTIPDRFVAKSGQKNRVGKIFVDALRNGLAATTISAWSARARPGLGISVPVDWSELESLRSADHWSVRTAHQRLNQGNAPWRGYEGAAQSLSAAMKTLGYPKTTQH